MVVLVHVTIALSSILYTTYLFFAPSQRKFYINYALIAATFASGTYLVISTHSGLLSACVAGLAYLSVVTMGSVLAHSRLIRSDARTHDKDHTD